MEKITFLFSSGQRMEFVCTIDIYDKILMDYENFRKTGSPKKIAYSISGDGRPEFIINPENLDGIFKLGN